MASSDSLLLPVLVADLADDGARDYLEGVALAGGVARVPLMDAPVDGSEHVLEVHTPGFEEPLILHAVPMGAPDAEGFPLRLSLGANASETRSKVAQSKKPSMRARRESVHTLTERHARELTGGGAHEAEPQDLVGKSLAAGKLTIESFVGSGGIGAVYRARHRELQIPVAVKVLHETFQNDVDFCRRFHAEALAASRLDHQNLTRVIDFGQEPDGTLYLAMEFLDGVELRGVLDQERRLPTPRIVELMSQVCAGLAHAHARGVIHRDIKPENLVLVQDVDDDGKPRHLVKVCDFGIAQVAAHEGESPRLAGTPAYMSPEQCAGEELDARSDVYACGVVLYEMLVGALPFTGRDPMQILNRQQHVAPTPPSQRVEGVDKALEAIVLKALEKDRDARFRDLRELRAALKSLLGGASTGHMRRVEVPDLSPSERRVKAAAPVVASGLDEPDWLERSGSWNHSSSTKSGHSSVPPPASSPLAAALVADPARVLARIAQTTDARTFRSIAGQLEAAIHELASAGDGGALWKLTSTLDVIATEPTQGPTTRAATAAVLLRVTYDPQVLAPIAESVLASAQNATDLGWRLLVRAGLGGAYAAYSARVKNPSPDARRRFVLVLHEIGIPALPVMRAGLERVEPRLATAGATELAEDLLAALPPVADEATG
ncbi:MAG TPA: serine/threonine-protein kinase, partial [Labilithrix sp.]